MVDIETLATCDNAAIVQIASVCFDDEAEEYKEKYALNYKIDFASKNFGIINGETVAWWMSQSLEAREAVFKGPKMQLKDALEALYNWIKSEPGENIVWGNGATFDNVKLRQAYERCGLEYPISFRNDLCYRTTVKLAILMGMKKPAFEGEKHNALDDARYQAKALYHFLRRLRNG